MNFSLLGISVSEFKEKVEESGNVMVESGSISNFCIHGKTLELGYPYMIIENPKLLQQKKKGKNWKVLIESNSKCAKKGFFEIDNPTNGVFFDTKLE